MSVRLPWPALLRRLCIVGLVLGLVSQSGCAFFLVFSGKLAKKECPTVRGKMRAGNKPDAQLLSGERPRQCVPAWTRAALSSKAKPRP